MARQIKTQLVVEGKNNASKAFKQAETQLGGISSAAKKAGAALLGAFSVAAVGSWVKNSIDAADEARKLAQAAGLTTEAFTGLQFAAGQSGVNVTELSGALTRLSRSMSDAATIGGRPAEVFARLGISVKDSEGSLRSADAVLSDLADQFQAMPDGVGKTAAAVELLGRSGAKLIPLLNGGSEGIKALTAQAQRLGLVMSDEQAIASERFNDSLSALGGASRGAANTVSAELLPTLNLMSGLFLDLAENSETASVFATLLGGTLKTLATIALIAGSGISFVGEGLAAIAASTVMLLRGDLDGAANVIADFGKNIEDSFRTTFERIDKIWTGGFEDAGKAATDTVKTMRELQDAALKSAEATNKAFADSYKKMVSAADKALKDLVRKEAAAQKDIQDIREKRLDIEQKYAEAIAGFSGGAGGPSYANAQDLKLDAQQRLRQGDVEGAQKSAEAALKMLSDLAAAGENTYGFEGFANELKAIELAANDLENTRADEKLAEIQAKVKDLNAEITKLTDFKINLELTEAEQQKIVDQIELLREMLGLPVTIPVVIAAPTEMIARTQQGVTGSFTGGATGSFASGGRIRGPGTGTSDSIMARLSNGEYVIKAAAVRKYGAHMFDNLNGMRVPKFADGGMVGSVSAAGGNGSTLNLSLDGQNYSLSGQADTIADLANAVRKANLKRR